MSYVMTFYTVYKDMVDKFSMTQGIITINICCILTLTATLYKEFKGLR